MPAEVPLRDRFGTFCLRDVHVGFPATELFFKSGGADRDLGLRVAGVAADDDFRPEAAAWVKQISILDPYKYMCGDYAGPENAAARAAKIAQRHNTAYVDAIMGAFLSGLDCAHFPRQHGWLTGVSSHCGIDISCEVHHLVISPDFDPRNGFLLDPPIDDLAADADSDSVGSGAGSYDDDDDDGPSRDSSDSGSETDSTASWDSTSPKQVAILLDVPVVAVFQERLDGELHDLLKQPYVPLQWHSALTQIAYGLKVAQERMGFVHGDLHTGNVMWKATSEEWIDCGGDRVRTFGRIFKIIDFGRSLAQIPVAGVASRKILMSDQFRKGEEAHGQYNWGPFRDHSKAELAPNPSFDLAYLAGSLREVLAPDQEEPDPLLDMLDAWCQHSAGGDLFLREDGRARFRGFNLCVAVNRFAFRAAPVRALADLRVLGGKLA